VVYKADITESQTLYADGPIQLEVENTQTYYMGPYGTHGTSDTSCSPATAGTPVPAQFRIFAPDHIYRHDGSGNQVPCPATGSFARGNANDLANSSTKVHAAWTLDADCTVVGNAAGTAGTGIAPAGSPHTYTGIHDPCFSPPCQNNIRVDYNEYLPFEGLHVSVGGPGSAQIGTTVTVTAAVTNDGHGLGNVPVSFTVVGPSPSTPPAGAAVTAADGTASFTFSAAAAGDYTVTATASNPSVASTTTLPGTTVPSTTLPATTVVATTLPSTTVPPTSVPVTTASGTHVVTFTPLSPPTLSLAGPASWQTQENLTVTATLNDAGNPVPATQVSFSVAGPGQATPASGTSITDQNGRAAFTFMADRAGDYTVSASASVATQTASATHAVHLDINTFHYDSALALSTGESSPRAGVIDPAGKFAYFASVATVGKFDLTTFQEVATATLPANAGSAVIDPAGCYAYFGTTNEKPARVVKVDLTTLHVVGTLTLLADEGNLTSAAIEPSGRYAYFGSSFSGPSATPGRVVKVDLATFQRVGAITLNAGEDTLSAALTDPAGRYAYFAAQNNESQSAGSLVRVDLPSFQRAGAALLDGGIEGYPASAVIDPVGRYAYLGTDQSGGLDRSKLDRVVKVDLTELQRVGAITLGEGESHLTSAVMDPGGRYALLRRVRSPDHQRPHDLRHPSLPGRQGRPRFVAGGARLCAPRGASRCAALCRGRSFWQLRVFR
jgi:hypothetical protein